MPKGIFRKTPNGLVPDDAEAQKMFDAAPMGSFVRATITQPRNLLHHRKYWKLINLVWENQDHLRTPEELHTLIKFRIGHTAKLKTKHGIVEYPLPTDFGKMDQAEFADYYGRAVDYICQEILPGMNKNDLENKIHEMLE